MAADANTPELHRLAGGCLCGAVRFTAPVRKRVFDACHCGMCRRWSAGAFMAVEFSGPLAFEDAASVGVYRSSEWAERGFCARCGSVLFYRMVGKDYGAVSLEALDDRDGFAFVNQIFIDEKPPYYSFADATKTMTGADVFAAFSGSGGSDGH